MKMLLTTAAIAALALTSPAFAQSTGTMLSGPGVTCAPNTASTGTSTDTTSTTTGTASTDTTTTGTTGTSTDTAASSGTSTDTTASTGTSTDTTGSSGTSTDTASTDTTASTSGSSTGTMSGSSTMALSADNQVSADTARSALNNFQTNSTKFSSLTAPTTVCIVDLDTLAASDTTLQGDISKSQANSAQIKSNLEGNKAVIDVIKAQHPSFDVNQVRAMDIGPNGELVLYVARSS